MRKWMAAGFLAVLIVVPATAASAGGNDNDDRSNHSDGKCKGAHECQDNDFSPDLQNSPVIICLPSSTCNINTAPQS